MKPEAVFKRYDIRGRYPEEIDEEFAERLGKALGTFVQKNYEPRIVVTRDTKESSVPLKEELVEGLRSTGVKVLDAGVGPTDYTAFTGQEKDAVSVQVTSSHMPLEFNGFKFMYPEGNGFLNGDLDRVKQFFREEEFETGEGNLEEIKYREKYMDSALELAEKYAEKRSGKVVVETMNGGTKDFLPELLGEIGFEVFECGEGGEIRINPPNPKPENLGHLEEKVEEEDADIGLATDLDADRVAAYYDGRWVIGDEIFCIFAQLLESDVVASVDSSKALEDTVEGYGGEIHYTRVGDPFVSDRMLEEGTGLSGEPNGHYCFKEFSGYNSGTLSALILAVLDLDKYLKEIPEYNVGKANFEVEEKKKAVERIRDHVEEEYEIITEKDGVKFSTENADVLVRSSGSSPIVRFKGETENSDLEPLKQEIEDVIRNS